MDAPKRSDYPLLTVKPILKERVDAGLHQAARAAEFLRKEYRVQDVYLFGSLLEPEWVHTHSDIDLAVTGLPEEYFYKAVGELLDLVEGFEVDVVDLDHCNESIRHRIMARCRKI